MVALGMARDTARKCTRRILSIWNCLKAIFLLFIFSCFVLSFNSNISFTRHKHAIGLEDLVFEEISSSSRRDANGFLHPTDTHTYCKRHGWNEYPRRQPPRKIYDLFMINSELDWLEIRLNELQHHVDYFVILESATTFTGLPKPLLFNEHRHNSTFSPFADKVIYHILQDPDPDLVEAQKWTQWDHEIHQRNAMFSQVLPFLKDAQAPHHGDVILVSDVDEIPRPATLTVLRNCEFPKRVTLRSRFYYYSFQWLHRGPEWAHPQATTYDTVNTTILPHDLRGGHGIPSRWFPSSLFFSSTTKEDNADLYNAAWHCSSCFSTIEELLRKMRSFSHIEYNKERYRSREWIVNHVRQGRDLWDRWGQWYTRVEGNLDVPAYVRGREERFKYLLDRDGEDGGFVDFVDFEG